MKAKVTKALPIGAIAVVILISALLLAHPREEKKAPVELCVDEAAMVAEYQTRLAELTLQVRQESQEDFQKAYHQKSCLTLLTLYVVTLDGALACLDAAAKDESAPKRQRESYKAKLDSHTALKTTLTQFRDDLKAAKNPAAAKAVIEKFEPAK